ncbi:hypothetical protein B0O99DRAFT_235034 [Bisporella sp. PMI_857]|nr:hypothetical protein B0O99DRAFT_235034 [Bisporella sp. PMI_857]
MSLFLAIFLLYAAPSYGQSSTSRAGPKFIKDGWAGDQLDQWEISYYAKGYLPICGLSREIEGSDYWSNSIECEPAMARFNSTSVSVGKYDKTGVESTKAFGAGEQLCMCFGLLHTSGTFLDICLLVGIAAEIREKSAFLSGDVAVGIQNLEWNSAKILPQCTDISLPTPSSTVTSEASRTTVFATTTPHGTPETTSPSTPAQIGINKAALGAGLGVGVPVVISLVAIGLWLSCRGRRDNQPPPQEQWQSQDVAKVPAAPSPATALFVQRKPVATAVESPVSRTSSPVLQNTELAGGEGVKREISGQEIHPFPAINPSPPITVPGNHELHAQSTGPELPGYRPTPGQDAGQRHWELP